MLISKYLLFETYCKFNTKTEIMQIKTTTQKRLLDRANSSYLKIDL
jgi:hypothetical protein